MTQFLIFPANSCALERPLTWHDTSSGDGGVSLQICRTAVNMLKKESRKTNRGWSAFPRCGGFNEAANSPQKASELDGLFWNHANNGKWTRRKWIQVKFQIIWIFLPHQNIQSSFFLIFKSPEFGVVSQQSALLGGKGLVVVVVVVVVVIAP